MIHVILIWVSVANTAYSTSCNRHYRPLSSSSFAYRFPFFFYKKKQFSATRPPAAETMFFLCQKCVSQYIFFVLSYFFLRFNASRCCHQPARRDPPRPALQQRKPCLRWHNVLLQILFCVKLLFFRLVSCPAPSDTRTPPEPALHQLKPCFLMPKCFSQYIFCVRLLFFAPQCVTFVPPTLQQRKRCFWWPNVLLKIFFCVKLLFFSVGNLSGTGRHTSTINDNRWQQLTTIKHTTACNQLSSTARDTPATRLRRALHQRPHQQPDRRHHEHSMNIIACVLMCPVCVFAVVTAGFEGLGVSVLVPFLRCCNCGNRSAQWRREFPGCCSCVCLLSLCQNWSFDVAAAAAADPPPNKPQDHT